LAATATIPPEASPTPVNNSSGEGGESPTPVESTPVPAVTALDAAEIPAVETAGEESGLTAGVNNAADEATVLEEVLESARPEVKAEKGLSPLTAAIRAAAARVGHGPEGLAAGRRLGEVVVTAAHEGQSQEPVEGTPKGIALRDLVHQVIDQASKASDYQTPPGDTGGHESGETLKLAAGHEPASPAGTSVDLGPAGLGGLGGRHTVANSQVELAADADQARMPESVSVRQAGDAVIRSVRYLSGKTDEVVTVRLVPRSLGELQVAVRSSADGVDVVLTTSTAAARDALEGNLAGLRQAMRSDGIDVNRVTVQVFGHFDAGHQTAPGQHGQQGQAGHTARYSPSAYREADGTERQHGGQQHDRRQRHDGRLNMWA
jgi:hypothetical protein